MPQPRLLVAAHGTESAAGSATTAALVAAVADALPGVPVTSCFLDVVGPSLTEELDAAAGPAVVVPLLLSTGYHVQTDIPAVVAGRAGVRVTAHLGPDPLVGANGTTGVAGPPGSAVQVPDPRRRARCPVSRSCSYAAATVPRPIPSALASSRSLGTRVPTASRPSESSVRTRSASAAYPARPSPETVPR